MPKEFSAVDTAIETLAQGGVVIVVDSEDRENEGDFLAASALIKPETIHFMISEGRGHLCQPIEAATARRLHLEPLVPGGGTNAPRFAMPVDFRECETGISPVDRALTIRSIVDVSTSARDFHRPGHIFPLIAHTEGVAGRKGHTEAAVDLTRIAGLAPSGVLCEICSADGRTMARVPELMGVARRFRLPIITIDAVVEFRQSHAEEFVDAEFASRLREGVTSTAGRPTAGRPLRELQPPPKKRVLVVEDDTIWTEYAKHVLESQGFVVDIALTCASAESAVRKCRPDVILMDAHLGPTDGIELVDRLRSSCGLETLPVIMVTGDSTRTTVKKAFEATIQGYIVKPYSPELLVQKVGQMLE